MTEPIWFQSYPPEAPYDISPPEDASLSAFLERTCTQWAQHPALTNFGTTFTYQALLEHSTAFAAWLQKSSGMRKGDRLAILLPNVVQYYIALMGALRAGLVVVNVNPLYTASELQYQLNDAGVSAVVVLANFTQALAEIIQQTSVKYTIITEIGDQLYFPKNLIFNYFSRYMKKGRPPKSLSALSFKAILKKGRSLPFTPLYLTHQDVAFLQYTGGTTGVAKGAILTHGNVLSNVNQLVPWMKSFQLKEGEENILIPLPLYHIFSMTLCVFCFLHLGGHGFLVTDPRNLSALIRLMAHTKMTIVIGINTLLAGLMRHRKFRDLSFEGLKLVVNGGMALQESVAQQWYELTGHSIIEGYGLTEASPVVTVNPPGVHIFNGSIGLPIPGTSVSIRDEENGEVSLGKPGELCIKGPQVMQAYWHHPEETQAVFTPDGWLKTGDVVRLDEKGFLYLMDRKKDMISVSGFKVYPHQVESVLLEHPSVKEVAVVGVPDKMTGESVKAVIVPNDPKEVSSDKILEFCRTRLTRYKIPHQIVFVSELPKSPIGKVLKRMLQES